MQIEAFQPAADIPKQKFSTADQLEQAFLEEMLKYAGPSAIGGEFSGGAGEEQFTSFLTREHAAQLAGRLDLGFDRMLEGRA